MAYGLVSQLVEEMKDVTRNNQVLESTGQSLREELVTTQRELGRLEAAATVSATEKQALNRFVDLRYCV